ncbi:uncharacterized protein [Macrobrachium rosenbergii]|uniref:uncharacterized protein n=1 Tax=Macrobrachium rosenbergii TaxID=79674 RepID=UPI0034D68FB6
MARTRTLFALLCLTSAALSSEVLSPFEGAQDDIVQSLNRLHETLLNQPPCEDRLDKMWKKLVEHSTITGEKMKELLGLMDDLGPVLATERGGECIEKFKKSGSHCLFTYTEAKWPWWSSRFLCWMLRAEMVNPEDLPEIRQFLPAENHKFWIGGRNADESLRFPVWKSVYGKRIWSDEANFTSIPQDSPKANCLAVDGNNEYRLQALDCEDKIMTVCQQRYKD